MEEQIFGKGAIVEDKVESLSNHADVAMDSAPVDWNLGYDVTHVIGSDLLTKNQGQAGSCGGEATTYLAEVFNYLNTKTYEPKSARYVYGQCFAPGGGSTDSGLIKILTNLGAPDTSVFRDYPQDGIVTEEFKRDVSDITHDINHNASACVLGQPIYVRLDFDSIAQAVRDNDGIIIGVYGQNGLQPNWLSQFPAVPTSTTGAWAHWLFVGKFLMINGKKYIGVKNSWGPQVGDNGWQYLSEDYLPFIWRAFTFVNTGIGTEFKHTFDTTKRYTLNSNSPEVKLLQRALKLDGSFPIGQACTGFFGNITLQAVNAFQTKYKNDILVPINLTAPTGIAGPRTLAKLNQLFS
jgi:hypothetical protein